MAHAQIWCKSSYGIHRYFYKVVGGLLYQKADAPFSPWVRLADAQLDISEHYISVTYPGFESFGLVEA